MDMEAWTYLVRNKKYNQSLPSDSYFYRRVAKVAHSFSMEAVEEPKTCFIPSKSARQLVGQTMNQVQYQDNGRDMSQFDIEYNIFSPTLIGPQMT